MHKYFDSCKKCYSHYYCSCHYHHKKNIRYIFLGNEHRELCEKIIKSYFNAEYIIFLYSLQKDIKLNKSIYNINALIDIFINLYDNSNIDCNKKNRNKLYDFSRNKWNFLGRFGSKFPNF